MSDTQSHAAFLAAVGLDQRRLSRLYFVRAHVTITKARAARDQASVIAMRAHLDEAQFWRRHALGWLRKARTTGLLTSLDTALSGCGPQPAATIKASKGGQPR